MLPLLLMLTAAAPAMAQQAEVIRLTPEEARAAMDAGTERNAAMEEAMLGDRRTGSGGVHGYASAFVGSGGSRGLAFGMAAPLGQAGAVDLNFANIDLGRNTNPYGALGYAGMGRFRRF
ncbi:hypothetical protein [Sandaracinobacteroides saxicola]|uniref:Uncharacterized protein n=1 Tax=Sandaracinobacteroides saxicola TaxID=2759707 RepID=A0A7G5IHZ7_9SPHN|nr:hypothetical protein [Sandaracinobacteroides saxicola]QMW22989.1 hypothetical protein H3309_00275 [Sandaracinobacteroides saxicola]